MLRLCLGGVIFLIFLIGSGCEIEEPPKRYIHAQIDNHPENFTIAITNLDNYDWHNVYLRLNQYYSFNVPQPVKAKEEIIVGYEMFKDDKGQEFDPAKEEVYLLRIITDEGTWPL